MANTSQDDRLIRASTKLKYVGARYGNMEILEVTRRDPKHTHHYFVLCRCDCGVQKETRLSGLQQGTTKSCGCAGKELRRVANLGNTRTRKAYGEYAKNNLFKQYRQHAESRGIAFHLTQTEFLNLTAQNCYYCNCPPAHKSHPKNAYGEYSYNGVDRVDNEIGYQLDNCVPACRPCNSTKNAVTKEMVMKIAAFLCRDKATALSLAA